MTNKILLSAVILAASSTSAIADEAFDASIVSMNGNVLVNQGESYRTATQGMNLKVGDRIMIMDGAELNMKYPDGCNFTFKDGQIVQIGSTSVCAMNGTGFVSATSAQYVQAAPGTSEDGDLVAATANSGAAAWTAGILLTGAAIYLATKDDDDNQPPEIPPVAPPVIPPEVPPGRPPQGPVSP
ncbi:MAG: hypothetical protein ACN4GR_07620 [Arenicellales bacterium]